jgi:hypothetical protein
MKVAVDFELLKAYLPERELARITGELEAKRENHRLDMRRRRKNHSPKCENHKPDVQITTPENGEIISKTAISGENSVTSRAFGGVGGDCIQRNIDGNKNILNKSNSYTIHTRTASRRETYREENLLKFAMLNSIPKSCLETWLGCMQKNNWRDKNGRPVRNPEKALKAFSLVHVPPLNAIARHEAKTIAFAMIKGLTEEAFFLWYEIVEENDFRDKDGNAIKNWVAHCDASLRRFRQEGYLYENQEDNQ